MFKKTNKNPPKLSELDSESIIPDPWETIAPDPHISSPLKLDHLFRQEQPLISAAAAHPAIPSVEMPTVLLPPPAGECLPMTSSVKVLLQNELKLPSRLASIKIQIGQALTLLYWVMTNSQQPTG
ncbi:hypothetical protein [Pantanalinema sp. GBBB05]|uniref:hypothetical protein n=1 Tax=Pantanalinema sp. GBBB05 TaxID=2604139 RepID=UPI001D6EA47A|nr:hypothetical protein [Pantanalinema sp. GBBB05]